MLSWAMAAVMGPIDLVQEILEGIDGYVVPANLNARGQSVIGGETAAVEEKMNRSTPCSRIPSSRANPSDTLLRKYLAGWAMLWRWTLGSVVLVALVVWALVAGPGVRDEGRADTAVDSVRHAGEEGFDEVELERAEPQPPAEAEPQPTAPVEPGAGTLAVPPPSTEIARS